MKGERSVFVLRPQESGAQSGDDWRRVIVPPGVEGDVRRFFDLVSASFDGVQRPPALVTRGPRTEEEKVITPCAEGTLRGKTRAQEKAQNVADPVEERRRLARLVSGNPYGGWDTVEVALWVVWDGFHAPRHFERLARVMNAKRSGGAERAHIELAGHDVEVTSGRKIGDVWTSFTLRCEGMTFCVAERRADSSIPNVIIRIGAMPLLVQPLRECWDVAINFVESFGGTVEEHVISRADFCVDMVNENCAWAARAVQRRGYVAKARDWKVFGSGSEATGVWIGGSGADCVCRIYDKVAELQATQNDAKREAMIAHRWGCEPVEATRVEFQMRGKFLRSLVLPGCEKGVRTIDELLRCEGAIVAYLTTEWLRFVSGRGGAHNVQKVRLNTSRQWKRVIEWFAAAASCEYVGRVRRITKQGTNARRLRLQGLGCLLKAVALTEDETPETFEELSRCLARQAVQWVEDVGGDMAAAQRVDDKFAAVAAIGPWAKQPLGGDGAVLPRPGESGMPVSWRVWLEELRVQRSAVPF